MEWKSRVSESISRITGIVSKSRYVKDSIDRYQSDDRKSLSLMEVSGNSEYPP